MHPTDLQHLLRSRLSLEEKEHWKPIPHSPDAVVRWCKKVNATAPASTNSTSIDSHKHVERRSVADGMRCMQQSPEETRPSKCRDSFSVAEQPSSTGTLIRRSHHSTTTTTTSQALSPSPFDIHKRGRKEHLLHRARLTNDMLKSIYAELKAVRARELPHSEISLPAWLVEIHQEMDISRQRSALRERIAFWLHERDRLTKKLARRGVDINVDLEGGMPGGKVREEEEKEEKEGETDMGRDGER